MSEGVRGASIWDTKPAVGLLHNRKSTKPVKFKECLNDQEWAKEMVQGLKHFSCK